MDVDVVEARGTIGVETDRELPLDVMEDVDCEDPSLNAARAALFRKRLNSYLAI